MPNPNSDANQLRFAQLRDRMLEGLAENCSEMFMARSGAKTRPELLLKLRESASIVEIVECCAYVCLDPVKKTAQLPHEEAN